MPDIKWYGCIICLGSERGYPIFTCTATWADEEIELKKPGEKYLKVVIKGIKETYDLPDRIIIEYLINSEGIKGQIDEEEITRIVKSVTLSIPSG